MSTNGTRIIIQMASNIFRAAAGMLKSSVMRTSIRSDWAKKVFDICGWNNVMKQASAVVAVHPPNRTEPSYTTTSASGDTSLRESKTVASLYNVHDE